MLITITNVEKDLGMEEEIVDVHFLTTSYAEGVKQVYVFETDLKTNRTYKVFSFLREQGDYSTSFAKARRSWRIGTKAMRYIINHTSEWVEQSTLEQGDRRSPRSLVIPSEMFRYRIASMSSSIKEREKNFLYQKQNEEYDTWGFEYAYLKSLDNYVDLEEMEFIPYVDFMDALDEFANDEINLYKLVKALKMDESEQDAEDIIRY